MSVRVHCKEVTKRFGTLTVLEHINWTLEAGSRWGLVGVSGAGKTTLLRIIAGLDRCSSGAVTVEMSQPMSSSRQRAVGMVFQNHGLWPHLTARQHLECVLSRVPRRERRKRAESLLSEVRIAKSSWGLRPAELSGGEGQRIALARALASDSSLLLVDEPLAQMHASLRTDLLKMLTEVIQRRKATVVYVSHAWDEMSRVCQNVAVLVDGRIEQADPVSRVYRHPATPHVARLTGPVVEVPKHLVRQGLIGDRASENDWLAVSDSKDGPLLVRPQQIRLVVSRQGHPWRVMQCRPDQAGWLATLATRNERLEVPSPSPIECQSTVRIEISSGTAGSLLTLAAYGTTDLP